MARIRRVSWASDLFGEEARGVSIPRITWGDYDGIVECIEKEFGRKLARVTSHMFEEVASSLGIVLKRSHPVTALLTSIVGTKVSFILSFDNFEVLPLIRQTILGSIHSRAKLGTKLRVESGTLIGAITIPRPINIVFVPERTKNETESWPNSGCASAEELAAIHRR
jgi:hypothetical protein